MTKADQSDTRQTNATSGPWMNLNLFSRNGSDVSNSSWYNSDELDDQQAAAALQRYQQLDFVDTQDEGMTAGSSSNVTLPHQPVASNHTRLHSEHHNGTELERTRLQSRAERAGMRP